MLVSNAPTDVVELTPNAFMWDPEAAQAYYSPDYALWADGYFIHEDDLDLDAEILNGRSDDIEMVSQEFLISNCMANITDF